MNRGLHRHNSPRQWHRTQATVYPARYRSHPHHRLVQGTLPTGRRHSMMLAVMRTPTTMVLGHHNRHIHNHRLHRLPALPIALAVQRLARPLPPVALQYHWLPDETPALNRTILIIPLPPLAQPSPSTKIMVTDYHIRNHNRAFDRSRASKPFERSSADYRGLVVGDGKRRMMIRLWSGRKSIRTIRISLRRIIC